MDFFRFFYPQTHFANMASDSNENNNIATTIEKSIDQCHSQVDNNSNKLETESIVTVNTNDHTTNNDSSVVSIEEFGVTKTLHILENVTPIEIIPTDNTSCKELEDNKIRLNDDTAFEDAFISNITAEASLVNVPEDVLVLNNNDLQGIQILCEAKVINDATALNDVIDDEAMQNLKDFDEALSNKYKTALNDDIETDFINLDEFVEIFDELEPVIEEPIAKNDSENIIYVTNENANDSKEKEIRDTTNERQPNINENIDVISISSTEDMISQTGQIKDTVPINAVSDQSGSDDDYNSSDFEFISETEANMTGFVINYGLDNCLSYLSPASSEPVMNYCGQYFDREVEREPSDPGEGPSRQNRPRNEFEDRSYRNSHHIPEGDDYLGLFQGIYNPLLPMSEIYFLENKSVRASAMNSQYDGIGFDKQLALRRHQPDSSEDEFEDEAKESAKKILNMYPGENRKRRRRHF